MLDMIEKKVVLTLCNELKEKPALLISPTDLLKMVGADNLSLSRLEKIVKDLNTDGYFDLVYSDRRGETVYCISLLERGKGFKERKAKKKKSRCKATFNRRLCDSQFFSGSNSKEDILDYGTKKIQFAI